MPPIHGHCACGSVTATLARAPTYVNVCNCTLCQRLGAIWVYDQPAKIALSGETRAFIRPDLADPHLTIHFCPICGTTVAWTANDPVHDRMALNAGLFPAGSFTGLEVRFPDNRADPGEGDRPPPRRAPGVVGIDLDL